MEHTHATVNGQIFFSSPWILPEIMNVARRRRLLSIKKNRKEKRADKHIIMQNKKTTTPQTSVEKRLEIGFTTNHHAGKGRRKVRTSTA